MNSGIKHRIDACQTVTLPEPPVVREAADTVAAAGLLDQAAPSAAGKSDFPYSFSFYQRDTNHSTLAVEAPLDDVIVNCDVVLPVAS